MLISHNWACVAAQLVEFTRNLTLKFISPQINWHKMAEDTAAHIQGLLLIRWQTSTCFQPPLHSIHIDLNCRASVCLIQNYTVTAANLSTSEKDSFSVPDKFGGHILILCSECKHCLKQSWTVLLGLSVMDVLVVKIQSCNLF